MRISITLALAVVATRVAIASAQSNIDPANKYAWGENMGWTNWLDANSGANGVVVGTDFLSGFIWGENIGWINVGDGTPGGGGGTFYVNANGTDSGVNIQADENLDGYAWGENIGWINFGTQPFVGAQGARFDFTAGRFRGYAWGENVGWINLDDAVHFVATVPGGCTTDVDCVDGDVCTCETCSAGVCGSVPVEFGNVECTGVIDLDDILCVLDGFAVYSVCPNADIAPGCAPSGGIDLDDILAVLDAFAGIDPCGCP